MSAEHQAMLEKAFLQCDNFQTLLGVYTGACSTIMISGEFDTEQANELMSAFQARLTELLFEANTLSNPVSVDLFIHNFFRSK